MTVPPTFVARPPRNGLRVRMEGRSLRARLLDEAELGYAALAVFVPVVRVDGSDGPLRIVVDGEPRERVDPHELRRSVLAVSLEKPDPDDPAAAERCGSQAVDAPLPAHLLEVELLALLVYFDRLPRGFVSDGDHDAMAHWSGVAAAVIAALDGDADRLRSAMVEPPRRTPAANDGVTFAISSCLYPCDILDHMPRGRDELDGPADAALLRLGRLLDGTRQPPAHAGVPELFIMAGDQVYVDATAGLFDPQSADDRYRIPYENMFASRGTQAVFRRRGLETRMLIDDHEIVDDWDPRDDELALAECDGRPWRARGIEAYRQFQRDLDLPATRRRLWTRFEHRGLPFFLADTRTERERRTVRSLASARIMSARQMRALKAWLRRGAGSAAPRFVVSPALLLPRRSTVVDDPHRALACDAWAGYPSSLHELLACVCDAGSGDVVFLSGDEHLSCDFRFELRRIAPTPGPAVALRSVHSSALYAPYPFANSRAEDLAVSDAFDFTVQGVKYRCETQDARFAPAGDGFALVTVAGVAVSVCFDRA